MVRREPRNAAFASPRGIGVSVKSRLSPWIHFNVVGIVDQRRNWMSQSLQVQLSMTTPTTGFLESDPSAVTGGGVTFEPVVNIPALSAFLFVAIVFSLLQLRINAVSQAAERRRDALASLREIKSKELSSGEGQIPPEVLKNAVTMYEQAIRDEEAARTIVPGVVRIVTPTNNNSNNPEDVAAAKQFLGIDLTSTNDNDGKAPEGGLPPMAVGVLALVGVSQIALLYMLSFDPMATSSTSGATYW